MSLYGSKFKFQKRKRKVSHASSSVKKEVYGSDIQHCLSWRRITWWTDRVFFFFLDANSISYPGSYLFIHLMASSDSTQNFTL